MTIGAFYELYDVRDGFMCGWLLVGIVTTHMMFGQNLGHACACDGEGMH